MNTAVCAHNLKWALLAAAASVALTARATPQDTPAHKEADTLVEALRAKNVETRRDAATRLRQSNTTVQERALPTMIGLLEKEPDGQVRLSILDALASLGPGAAPAVPALVQTLRADVGGRGEEALHQDYRSALALAAIGKPAVEGLRSLLTVRKVSVRAEAIMALGRIGPDAATAIPDLILVLADKNDKNERIAEEVSIALGRIGNSAVDPLIAATAHADSSVRARAATSLGSLSAPTDLVHQAVLKCARDQAPEVRAAAVESLSKFKLSDDALLPIVKENVRNNDERVRLAVVNLLVERPALLATMAPELGSLLSAKNEAIARHAAFLLGKSGASAVPVLLGGLRHPAGPVEPIADALGQIGRPAVEPLTQAVKDPEPRVRRGAALALGQIRPVPKGNLQTLAVGLRDPDRDVRAAFLTAIGYLGPRASEAVPAVRSMLRDESPAIRAQAIDVLSQAAPRDEHLLGDVIAVLKNDVDPRVVRQAIETTRSLGPGGRDALPIVIGKLSATYPEDVRLAAALMIESHGQAAVEAASSLCAALNDGTPKLQATAARALATMGKAAQPAFAKLAELVNAGNPEAREAAVSTLGGLELEPDVIRPPLARALRDEKPEVRRAATRVIQRLGPAGAIFIPDIILLAEKKENQRSVERTLRRFETSGPDVRSVPELVKHLKHDQTAVRLLAIKFLALAGPSAKAAIPDLERLRQDPSPEVRKLAAAASESINKKNTSGGNARGS
jgi:HEAT repeat protein